MSIQPPEDLSKPDEVQIGGGQKLSLSNGKGKRHRKLPELWEQNSHLYYLSQKDSLDSTRPQLPRKNCHQFQQTQDATIKRTIS